MSQSNNIKRQRNSEYQKKWRESHPNYYDKYREANREKAKESSRKWREKNPEAARLHRANRRARVRGARVQPHIRKTWIMNWESRICGICQILIEGDYHIDHITPLSRGGTHSADNLQLTHPFCNQSKFNKL